MKRLTYLLALGALLVLGTGCDKESATDNTPVPLYVNTWVITESNSDEVQSAVFCFNADKTFYGGYIVNEAMLKKYRTTSSLPPTVTRLQSTVMEPEPEKSPGSPQSRLKYSSP